jgi:hypothetical protein
MSTSMYQSNVQRLTKDIGALRKQEGDEIQRLARLDRDIASIQQSITKSTSPSLLKMKLQQIASKTDEIGRVKRKLGHIQSTLSSKLTELHRNEQNLTRAEEQDRKKKQSEDEKRRREELRHTRQITSELQKQRQFTPYTSVAHLSLSSEPIIYPFVDESTFNEIADESIEDELSTDEGQNAKKQRRKGGPVPTPDHQKQALIQGWLAVQGHMSQVAYCDSKGISPSTLRKWMRDNKIKES